jgi:hypothetical protein
MCFVWVIFDENAFLRQKDGGEQSFEETFFCNNALKGQDMSA